MAFGLGGVGRVTDLRGREVGDAVLTEAARRLRAGTGPDDVLARLDGDAFVVVTDGGAVQAHLLATRLLTVLTEPYPTPAAGRAPHRRGRARRPGAGGTGRGGAAPGRPRAAAGRRRAAAGRAAGRGS